jgi:hypothetical protein
MKKKWLMLGGVVGISGALMVTTGLSAMAATSGYDAYKSALKNTKTVSNVSVQAKALLQDNGSDVANANGSFKFSQENRLGSGNVTVNGNGAEQSIEFFKQADGTVVKPSGSDIYYVKPSKEKRSHPNGQGKQEVMPQQVETVIDALVGNLKDYVAVDTKADGSKQVSVQLTNAQIPAVINAIAPIAIKQATNEHNDANGQKDANDQKDIGIDGEALLANAPKLTQDIKIEKVDIKADINASNYIEHQQAVLTVSGKDDNGVAHQVTLQLNADLSGYNSTTPDNIDLTGKNVQTINKNDKGHE